MPRASRKALAVPVAGAPKTVLPIDACGNSRAADTVWKHPLSVAARFLDGDKREREPAGRYMAISASANSRAGILVAEAPVVDEIPTRWRARAWWMPG